MPSTLDNIFGNEDEQKKKSSNTSVSRTVNADPLSNIFADTPKTPKQEQVQGSMVPETPVTQPVKDKASGFFSTVAVKAGDLLNTLSRKLDENSFRTRESMKPSITKDPITGKSIVTANKRLEAFDNAKTQEEKDKLISESNAELPIMKFFNSEAGKKVTGTIAEKTSNIPLKTYARFKSVGDETYDEAYSALLAKSKDPNNPRWQKILYGVQDSGVQSAVGVLLSLGASALARGNPNVGRSVAGAYFAGISAEGERDEKGNVNSLGNIAIDTVGDTVLTGIADAALKNFVKNGGESAIKSYLKQGTTGFATEGGTEVTQSLLKYTNDYANARTEEDKQKVAQELASYIKNGGLVDEFLIGGIAGAGTTVAAAKVGDVMGKQKGKTFDNLVTDINELEQEYRTSQDDRVAAALTDLKDQINDYQTAFKQTESYVSDDTQEMPLATISTVRYPNGKYGFSFDANTETNSIGAPFNFNDTYATKEEAVKAAKDAIDAWVTSTKETTTDEQEAQKLQTISDEIKKKPDTVSTEKVKQASQNQEAVQETVEEKPVKSTEKARQEPLAKSSTQESINVRKAPIGYRVSEYSNDGQKVGDRTARFVKSPTTGKTSIVIKDKDGKVVKRMTLDSAKKRFGTSNRAELVDYVTNGKLDKKSGRYVLNQSRAPVIRNSSQKTVEKKPVVTEGEVKVSRAFERVRDRLGAYAENDLNYNKLNLADDAAKAIKFVEENPKEARKIALGMMGAPQGVTETAISIALAEKAAKDGDYALQAQLERSRSLRQTRRGQEIVAERGRVNENSSSYFIQQVLAARLDNIGKVKFLVKKGEKQTKAQAATAKIQENAATLKKQVKKELSRVDLAQNLIETLTC